MSTCLGCSFKNEPTTAVCVKCGLPLPHEGDHPTHRQSLAWKLRHRASWDDIRLSPTTILVLYVATVSEPLILPQHAQILIGRAGTSGLRQPHVDLTPYHAVNYGVSRLHASLDIRHETVYITDLQSMNGTYLNDLRLSPGQSKIVCNGDTLCFGNLLASIYFRERKEHNQ
jgi:hypothetical protein